MALSPKVLQARRRYAELRKKFFGKSLPLSREIRFSIVEGTLHGECTKPSELATLSKYDDSKRPWLIELRAFLFDYSACLDAALIHEMIHLKFWPLTNNHEEPLWSEEVDRLAMAGVCWYLI